MNVIGITGPSGAGKSMFSDILRSKNIPVIDADDVYHRLLVPPSECLDALTSAFGNGILDGDGCLDRTALSGIVFADESKLALLNETVLTFVIDKIRSILSELEREGNTAAAVDAPTLIESGFNTECDAVVSILSNKDIRTERIMSRDRISRDAALSRISAQKPDGFYREHSDYVIINNGDIEDLTLESDPIIKALGL